MIRYAPLFLLCMLGLGCSKPAPPPPVPLPPTVTSVPGAAGLMRARGMTQHDGTIHIELGGRVTQVRVVRTDGHPLYPAWVDVLALPSGSTLVSVIDSRAESPPGFVVLPSDPDRGISVPYALEIRLPQEPPAPPVIEDPELYRALYDLPALNGALSTTESAPAVDPAATATTESDALLLDQSADSGPAGPFRECVTYA